MPRVCSIAAARPLALPRRIVVGGVALLGLAGLGMAPAPARAQSPALAAPAGEAAAPASSPAAPTAPATGGTGADSAGSPATATGGHTYGQRFQVPPAIASFRVAPTSLLAGTAAVLRFRVESPVTPRVRLVVTVRRLGSRAPVARGQLGTRLAGRALSYRWSGVGRLGAGRYVLELRAVDGSGRALARAASARVTVRVRPRPRPRPAPAPVTQSSGVFPVAGPHTYGDGFGVNRGDHIHMGQDMPAAEGTPLVSPRRGTVQATGYSASGAGNYVVIRDSGRDRTYVFMHLQSGSTAVSEGQPVSAGQRIGRVGSTGDATGPHLHFEEWIGAWYGGGHAIDPLPDLRRWDR
jgi:murein DD-endopeptidase MepM/ murein hydrolase activator NlpD